MTYQYSLATDFPSGLINTDLKQDIGGAAIVPVCTDVRTDDDDVFIDFDATLSGAEQTTLDGVVAAYTYVAPRAVYRVDDIMQLSPLSLLNRQNGSSFSCTTTLTEVPNTIWTADIGTLSGFDTGVFTCPTGGIYFYNFIVSTTAVHTNSNITIEFQDAGGNFLFGTTSLLGAHPASTFLGTGGYFEANDEIHTFVKTDNTAMNITCSFRVVRFMQS